MRSSHRQSVYGVLMGLATAADNILTTAVPNLHIMPSTQQLAQAEVELYTEENAHFRLRDALAPIMEHYDYILLDCPPAMGNITINALTTADAVIIPMQCEFYSLEGVQQLINTIEGVRRELNPKLGILGVLLTMYDGRNGLTRAIESEIRNTFGDTAFKTVIPRNVRVSEAPSHGKPALFYDFNSTGAQAYLRVATEVVERTEQGE